MAGVTVPQMALINELAAVIADLVTTTQIADRASNFGLEAIGSNKADKLRYMLCELRTDQRRTNAAVNLISTLVMDAHQRHVTKKIVMNQGQIAKVIELMNRLGWPAGDLKKLKLAPQPQAPQATASTPSAPAPSSVQPAPERAGAIARPHPDILSEIAKVLNPDYPAQMRGRMLETFLAQICKVEGLRPVPDVRTPGEQTDIFFTCRDQHYLVECKWESGPVGVPHVTAFHSKLETRSAGTRGVFLSMSGYTQDIEARILRGRQISQVGLAHDHLMAVIEGRATWTDLVLEAHRNLAMRHMFVALPAEQLLLGASSRGRDG